MISDVLAEAIQAIRRGQRDFPECYGGVAKELSVVLTVMEAVRLALDMAPDAATEAVKQRVLASVRQVDVSRVIATRAHVYLALSALRRTYAKVERLRGALEQLAPSVGETCTYTQLRISAGLDNPSMKTAVQALIDEGLVKEITGSKARRYERLK
jgi:hypothetical protein